MKVLEQRQAGHILQGPLLLTSTRHACALITTAQRPFTQSHMPSMPSMLNLIAQEVCTQLGRYMVLNKGNTAVSGSTLLAAAAAAAAAETTTTAPAAAPPSSSTVVLLITCCT